MIKLTYKRIREVLFIGQKKDKIETLLVLVATLGRVLFEAIAKPKIKLS